MKSTIPFLLAFILVGCDSLALDAAKAKLWAKEVCASYGGPLERTIKVNVTTAFVYCKNGKLMYNNSISNYTHPDVYKYIKEE